MTIDLFIRTYPSDYQWLAYALRSISKFVTGHAKVIVTSPDIAGLSHLTREEVFQCPDLPDGYLGQQLTKLTAYKWSTADAIVFWDSDCIATEPINVAEEYFRDGKPAMYKTRYASKSGPILVWKETTEAALGFKPEYEYMRRHCMTYLPSTLRDVVKFLELFHDKPIETYLGAIKGRRFSEFNVMGAYADRFEHDNYHFMDTETTPIPPNKVKQYWSHGGITHNIRREIEAVLG